MWRNYEIIVEKVFEKHELIYRNVSNDYETGEPIIINRPVTIRFCKLTDEVEDLDFKVSEFELDKMYQRLKKELFHKERENGQETAD